MSKPLLIFLVLFSISSLNVYSQELDSTSMEELYTKTEKRPVLIFMTAEWCTYCEKMKNTSLKEDQIIRELNERFYFVEFDIEQREDVKLGDTVFKYKPTGLKTGTHELAELIGTIDGVLNTPSIILLNSDLEIVYRYGGYMDTEQLQVLLESI